MEICQQTKARRSGKLFLHSRPQLFPSCISLPSAVPFKEASRKHSSFRKPFFISIAARFLLLHSSCIRLPSADSFDKAVSDRALKFVTFLQFSEDSTAGARGRLPNRCTGTYLIRPMTESIPRASHWDIFHRQLRRADDYYRRSSLAFWRNFTCSISGKARPEFEILTGVLRQFNQVTHTVHSLLEQDSVKNNQRKNVPFELGLVREL